MIAVAVVLATAFAVRSAFANEDKTVKTLVTQYYDAVFQKDYETALDILYRKEDTIFTDEFLISGMRAEPLISYKFQDVKQLEDNVYEITGLAECNDGRGEQIITNYVIYYNSMYYFVINWMDVPEELYDFRTVMGF